MAVFYLFLVGCLKFLWPQYGVRNRDALFLKIVCLSQPGTLLKYLISRLLWSRFVNLMDGHIWIESEGVGRGSIVTFVVKLNVPEANHLSIQIAPTSQPSGSGSRTDFSGVRVLVTDDNG